MGKHPDLNPDGTEVIVTLLMMRYHAPDKDEYDTIEEAQEAAEYLIDWNSAAPVAIIVDGDLKLYNRYDHLRYGWVVPDAGEAAFVKERWPEYFKPKEVTDGRGSAS